MTFRKIILRFFNALVIFGIKPKIQVKFMQLNNQKDFEIKSEFLLQILIITLINSLEYMFI